jgi:hypothetical protein
LLTLRVWPLSRTEAAVGIATFEWLVPQTGYRRIGARHVDVRRPRPGIREHTRRAQAFLAQAEEQEEDWTRTLPFRDAPGLLQEFAQLEPHPTHVLAFAQRHGWLGLGQREVDPMRVPSPRPSRRLVPSEALVEWAREIFAVRQAVDLLTAARERDESRLRRWLRVRNGHASYRRQEPSTSRELARVLESESPGAARQFPPAAFTFALKGSITIERSEGLADYVQEAGYTHAARFVAQRFINAGLDAHTCARCIYDPETDQHRLSVYPWNLIGAIWVQTAEMAQGGRDYRRCASCRGWFAVSPGVRSHQTRRANARYCSGRCRFKAGEDRNKRARALHAKGMSPSQIARKLGSKPESVRRWLGIAQGSR